MELQFAEMKDPVKDKMRQFELFEHMGRRPFIQRWAQRWMPIWKRVGLIGSPEWPGERA